MIPIESPPTSRNVQRPAWSGDSVRIVGYSEPTQHAIACDRILSMLPEDTIETTPAAVNPFVASDVASLLREHGWLVDEPSLTQVAWCERAAALLGPHAADRGALGDLLGLVFAYDADAILQQVESHIVLARSGAREVIRELSLLVLEDGAIDSDRYKEIVTALKARLELRGRELFHPIRLSLAGRAGEGELDRVILLLDFAGQAGFNVKRTRVRILEFCAALD